MNKCCDARKRSQEQVSEGGQAGVLSLSGFNRVPKL